jgi:hypothetical protein
MAVRKIHVVLREELLRYAGSKTVNSRVDTRLDCLRIVKERGCRITGEEFEEEYIQDVRSYDKALIDGNGRTYVVIVHRYSLTALILVSVVSYRWRQSL